MSSSRVPRTSDRSLSLRPFPLSFFPPSYPFSIYLVNNFMLHALFVNGHVTHSINACIQSVVVALTLTSMARTEYAIPPFQAM